MRIFHLATAADWAEALRSGEYTTSTLGRTLAEEGFLHAARADQVAGVHERYYGDVTEPLLVLTIETDLLDVPWREDQVGAERFPHVYGRLAPEAVVSAEPFESWATGRSGSATHSLHEPG